MPRGRQTRTLRPDQIERLKRFRMASHDGAPHGYSLPQLRLAMDASFGWETLRNALLGRPIWDLSHAYIVQWLDRYIPAADPPIDGKTAAAGEREEFSTEKEDAQETEGTTRTVRGSR